MVIQRAELYRKLISCVVVAAIVLLTMGRVQAQYILSEVDPIKKWSEIELKNQRVVFPQNSPHLGIVVASYLDTLSPHIMRGFSSQLQNFPVLIHTQNILSNGMVTYVPKRMELYSIPSRNTFATQWLKQLTVHEYRHVAQLSSLNVGFTKAMSYVIGELAPGIVTALVPSYFLEGDAVLAETIFTTFGRGRQPEFSVEMRALLNENITVFRDGDPRKLNYNKLSLGSENHFVPDKYKSGYIMVGAATRYFGYDFWDKVMDYTGRYPYTILPTSFAFDKYGEGYSSTDLAMRAFDDLRTHWNSHAEVDNSTTIIPTKLKSYSTYSGLLPLNDTLVVALKADLDKANRYVVINTQTAQEQALFYAGYVTARPTIKDNTLYWTEYAPSRSWGQKNSSIVCQSTLSINSNGRVRHTEVKRHKVTEQGVFYITPMAEDKFAMIGYGDLGFSHLFITNSDFEIEKSIRFPWFDASFNGLSWDNLNNKIVGIILNNEGMWLGEFNPSLQTFDKLTQASYVTLDNLSANDGKLYYTSIYTGKDEVHEFDMASRTERTLTESTYGTKASSLAKLWSQPQTTKASILATTYTSQGYLPSSMELSEAKNKKVEYVQVPVELFNIGLDTLISQARSRGEIINIDSVRVDESSLGNYPIKRYRKGQNLFNIHSWAPIYVGIDRILNERELAAGFGASFLTQNLLSTMSSVTSLGYYKNSFALNSTATYSALPVKISASIDYGGGYQGYQINNTNSDELEINEDTKNYLAAGVAFSLPFNLSRGAVGRYLTMGLSYDYTNTLLLEGPNTWEGVHKISPSISYQSFISGGSKDIAPPIGCAFEIYSSVNPFYGNFGYLFGVYAKGYFPGFAENHSFQLSALGQYQIESKFNFSQKGLFATGAYSDFTAQEVYSLKTEYAAPVLYPNWGAGPIIYFRRIDLKLMGDYSYADPTRVYEYLPWRHFYTYGVGIDLSVNLFKLSNKVKLGFLLYKTNTYDDLGITFSFGVDI